MEIVGGMVVGRGAPSRESRLRDLAVVVKVRPPEGASGVRALRLSMSLKEVQARRWGRLEAVGMLAHPLSELHAVTSLPLGLYDLRFESVQGRHVRFSLEAGSADPVFVCEHGVAAPSRDTTHVFTDASGAWTFMEQEVDFAPCCVPTIARYSSLIPHNLTLYRPRTGAVTLDVGGRPVVVHAGEYLAANPGMPNGLSATHKGRARLSRLLIRQPALRRARDIAGLPKAWGPLGFRQEPRRVEGGVAEALALYDRARTAWGTLGAEELARTALRWLVLELLREHPSEVVKRWRAGPMRPPRDARLQAIVAEMEQRYADALRIPELARTHGVSVRWMSRQFRLSLGESPLRYLQELRMSRADHLLRTTSKPVEDIASEVGFRDVRQFYRTYLLRRHMSVQVVRPG